MAGVVVVGVDGSESSGKAARRAAEVAAALGASLHVVTAYEGTAPEVIEVGSDVWMISSGDEANTMLDGVVADLRGIVGTITTDALEGKPADILVSEAVQMEATRSSSATDGSRASAACSGASRRRSSTRRPATCSS